jgi:hypothetical protein
MAGVEQDRRALAAGVIDRMVARYEHRRRIQDVADKWC